MYKLMRVWVNVWNDMAWHGMTWMNEWLAETTRIEELNGMSEMCGTNAVHEMNRMNELNDMSEQNETSKMM